MKLRLGLAIMTIKILAIETALDACSVAIKSNDLIKESFLIAPRQQTHLILPMIEQLLADWDLKISDLDALALSYGPGNFTGLRIGSSVIQALAFTSQKPIVLVSTLQAIAQGAWREHQIEHINVVVDAHMQEVYCGSYQLSANNIMTAQVPDQIDKPELIKITFKDRWLGVGSGWKLYEKILLANSLTKPAMIDFQYLPHAYDVAEIAAVKFSQGEYVNEDAALPNYLRGAEAWKKIK